MRRMAFFYNLLFFERYLWLRLKVRQWVVRLYDRRGVSFGGKLTKQGCAMSDAVVSKKLWGRPHLTYFWFAANIDRFRIG